MSVDLQVRSTSPPIPWHIGMAADRFIADLTRSDRQAVDVAKSLMGQVGESLKRRGRHSPVRPEQLVDLERAWRQRMPAESRLGYTVDWLRNRRGEPKGLIIHDYRASALGLCSPRWDEGHTEMGLTLLLIAAHIMPGNIRLLREEQALVLRHAIARRYERGHPATAEAVVEDLRHIAHTRLTNPTACVIAVDSGRWMGRRGSYENSEVLIINTFYRPAI
jgi:hypothetical protein